MSIATNLAAILAAKYGQDVRQAIHDSISQNYSDMSTLKTLSANAVIEAKEATTAAQAAQLYADEMASGSPKGQYATLVALRAAFPTGDTGAYFVQVDSHLYFWDTVTSAWVDGGEYNVAHASKVTLTDVNSHFTSTNVEGAFDELGYMLDVGLDFTGDTGDERGTNAIDLQKSRASSDRVAASEGSFIAGGYSNKIANWVERDSDAKYGHAEGHNNTVYEWYGHAEGTNSINDGKISHSEGNSQICSANDSHCEGDQNICGRKYFYDITGGFEPIVTGSQDAGDGLGVLEYIVVPNSEGNVSSYFPNALTDNIEARYGAGFTKDIKGNIYSTVYGGTQATWDGDTLLTVGTLRWAMHPFCVLHGSGEGQNILVRIAKAVYASGSGTKVYYYGAKPYTTLVGISSSYSPIVLGGSTGQHAEGTRTSTWGHTAHAEGFNTRAWSQYSHAEGYRTQALKRSTHAEGENTISNGQYAHAEGKLTQANGDISHAEGNTTVAAGAESHAEGRSTQANGQVSHAQGQYTKATGHCSNASGLESDANRNYQNSYSAGKLAVIGDNQVSSIMYTKACAGVGWHDIAVIKAIVNGMAYNFETMVVGRQTAGTEEAIGNTFAYKFTGCFIAGTGAITVLGTPVRTLIGRSAGMSGDGLTSGVRLTWYGYYSNANGNGAVLKYDGVADTTFQVSSYTTWQEMGLPA